MSSNPEIGIKLSLAGAQQVEAGLRKVGGSLGGLDGAVAAARQSLMTLVPALGAAFSAASMGQMLKGVSDTANEIDRLARLADSSPREFQRYAAAAKTVGVDMEKFSDITKDVQDKLGDFMQTGGGELKDFFEKIAPKVGVTAASFKNLSGPQALQLFYSSLQKANLSQKETVFWLESIADDASLLAPLLANSGTEIQRLGDKAEASGAQMSDFLIASSKQLTEQVGEMDSQLKSAKNTLAQQLFPALTETARALVDFGRDSSAAELAADGIRVVFETVAITGANVAYVLKMTGRELGGLAAQAALVMGGEFKAAGTVGDLMKQDAAKARAELDAFEQRILNASKNAKEYFALSDSLKKAKFGSEDFIKSVEQLAGMQNRGAISAEQLAAALRAVQPAAQTAGKGMSGMGIGAEEAKKAADELKKAYQSALDGAASQARDLTAESDKLNAAEKKLLEIIANPAWAKWNATQRETVRALYERNSATIKSQELAEADEKWLKETADENLKFAEAAFSAADAAEEQARQQLLANEAIGLSGTALADLEAIRLRDAAAEKTRQAAVMDGIDPGIAESYRRQAAALQGLADAKQAGAVKQQLADVNQEAKEAWKQTASQIEQSLTDALMRGFESGKGFGQNLVDTLKNMFQTLVLRPVIQAIVSPVTAGALGISGTGSAYASGSGSPGGGLGSAMSLSSAYDLLTTGVRDSISKGFTKLASTDLGQQLGLYDADAGVRSLTGTGQAVNSALQSAGGSMMAHGLSKGLSGGYQVGNGKIMDAATLVAGWFDPTGGLIAGAVSGAINRAFGLKLADSGLQGTFGGSAGFSGQNYQHYDGGWFRSDKTKTGALSSEIETGLADQFKAMQASTGLMAQTLGLGTTAIKDFTRGIQISFKGLTDEQVQTRLTDEFNRIGDSLAAAALGTQAYTRTGETALQTLQRLSSSLSTVNGTFDVLGRTLYAASLSGADMASSLVDLMGGLEHHQTTTTAYYEAFYSDADRAATATRQLTASLSSLGFSLPATRDAYRALIEAQDLSTDAGRSTYAALMGLSAAFAAITPSAADLAAQLKAAQDGISGLLAALIQSVSEGRAAIAEARKTVNGPAPIRQFAQIQASIAAAGPDSAVQKVKAAKALVDSAASGLAYEQYRLKNLLGVNKGAGEWYVQQAKNELASAQYTYMDSLIGLVDASKISVQTLGKLREETVAYYESQRELAAVMQTSAAGVRESIKLSKLQTLTIDQSMAARRAEFSRNYSLALSTTGVTKAGYADQLAGALPQLSQDLASMSASRADWAMSVAQLSAQAAKVADQLDATAPKNYQAEANTLLSAIDAKLLAVNASATSAEAVISKAVNDGATRTAAGLQQIINQLQGKSVSAFAKGGVFTNSIVSTPTLAPMALFGEAGDEAIMPLSRGPGGVLGVQAFGAPSGDRADSRTTERLLRELVAEVQRLNAQLQEAKRTSDQARQENNVGNSKIADSADRLARLVERWDAVGLPPTAEV